MDLVVSRRTSGVQLTPSHHLTLEYTSHSRRLTHLNLVGFRGIVFGTHRWQATDRRRQCAEGEDGHHQQHDDYGRSLPAECSPIVSHGGFRCDDRGGDLRIR